MRWPSAEIRGAGCVGVIVIFVLALIVAGFVTGARSEKRETAECTSLGGTMIEGGRFGDDICADHYGKIIKVYKYGGAR